MTRQTFTPWNRSSSARHAQSPLLTARQGTGLVAAPGGLRGRELEVLGWSTDQWSGETAVICRLVDGSPGEVPARWTDLPWRARPEAAVGGLGSPAGWRLLLARVEGLRSRPGRAGASSENGGADGGTARVGDRGGDGGARRRCGRRCRRRVSCRWRCGSRGCWRGWWRPRAMSDVDKITEQHRRLRAIVYVRQSSPGQVQHNHESRALQYALRDRAIELGWPAESVSVVDEDLARSASSADGRRCALVPCPTPPRVVLLFNSRPTSGRARGSGGPKPVGPRRGRDSRC